MYTPHDDCFALRTGYATCCSLVNNDLAIAIDDRVEFGISACLSTVLEQPEHRRATSHSNAHTLILNLSLFFCESLHLRLHGPLPDPGFAPATQPGIASTTSPLQRRSPSWNPSTAPQSSSMPRPRPDLSQLPRPDDCRSVGSFRKRSAAE